MDRSQGVMKSRATLIILILLFTSAAGFSDTRPKTDKRRDKSARTKIERKLPVDPQVSVSVCISSGNIKVNGWDRAEVRARSGEATDIQLKRKDEGTGPSKKISVRVVDKESDNNTDDPCDAFSDIELDVPRGATVQL